MTTKLQPQVLAISNKTILIESLPNSLKKEMQKFISRNIIVKNYCCKSCLNAHILKKANDLQLEPEFVSSLKEEMKEGIGHNDYYLDNNQLIKI